MWQILNKYKAKASSKNKSTPAKNHPQPRGKIKSSTAVMPNDETSLKEREDLLKIEVNIEFS